MHTLTITCDDLGYSDARDAAILRCHAAGGATRASLLVTGASAARALAAAAAAGLPVGLHVNLTEGAPAAPRAAVASLLGADGLLRGKHGLRAALAAGAVAPAHIAAEVAAQFARFAALSPRGAPPAHADGHQHVHVLPGVAAAFAAAAAAAGVRDTRLPAPLPGGADGEGVDAARAAFYAGVGADAAAAAPVFAAAGLRAADAFVGFSLGGAQLTPARLGAALRAAAAGGARSVELMVHPGRTSAAEAVAPGAAGCGAGADEFSLSADRDAETAALCAPALLAAAADAGFAPLQP
jgi:predicted glycoside hydrolase/deacetylase ChbG (UPF0249 family)